MKMYGIELDCRAVAKGLIDMTMTMDDNYQGALAFGMLPAPLMEILGKQLKEKFVDLVQLSYPASDVILNNTEYRNVLLEEYGITFDEAMDKFTKKASKEIGTIMYQVASERGILVV
jgi:hypothetical protein